MEHWGGEEIAMSAAPFGLVGIDGLFDLDEVEVVVGIDGLFDLDEGGDDGDYFISVIEALRVTNEIVEDLTLENAAIHDQLSKSQLVPCHLLLQWRVVHYSNGHSYKGQWRSTRWENWKHGRGIYSWPLGDVYIGDWREGRQHGHGKYRFPDGRVFDGDWAMGEPHIASGRCTDRSGRSCKPGKFYYPC
jgi:hypothetical protein